MPRFQVFLRQLKIGTIVERRGCDEIGEYRVTGTLEGPKVKLCILYDAGPQLQLEGTWSGTEPHTIQGTWNAGPDGIELLAKVGLSGDHQGSFKLSKRAGIHDVTDKDLLATQPAAAAGDSQSQLSKEQEAAMKAARDKLKEAQELVQTMRQKIAELKTYKVEPKCVQVLHAAFVLLGASERSVVEWNETRKRLNDEFYEAMLSFDEKKKAPKKGVLSAVKKLLKGLDEETVKNSSQALLCVYTWANAGVLVIEEAKRSDKARKA